MQYAVIVTDEDGTNHAYGPTTSEEKAQTWADCWGSDSINAIVLPLTRIPRG